MRILKIAMAAAGLLSLQLATTTPAEAATTPAPATVTAAKDSAAVPQQRRHRRRHYRHRPHRLHKK